VCFCRSRNINFNVIIFVYIKNDLIVFVYIYSGIGAGAVRSSLIAFGADQIQDSIIISRYIDKLVVAISLRSILNTLVTILIEDDPNHSYIIYVYGIGMLFLSALIFFIGYRYYIHAKPYDSVVLNCFPVVINAYHSWRQYKKSNKDRLECSNTTNRGKSLTSSNSVTIEQPSPTFLDFAQLIHHGNFQERIVEDVKLFRNAIIILILLFPYRIIFDQVIKKNNKFQIFKINFIFSLIQLLHHKQNI